MTQTSPSQEYSPGDIDPVSNHVIGDVDENGRIISRIPLPGGGLTPSAVAQFGSLAASGDLLGYYSYLESFGSGYGAVGVAYHDGKLVGPLDFAAVYSNYYSTVHSGFKFNPWNDTFGYTAQNIVTLHYSYMLEDGFIPTTEEIFNAHFMAFESLGIGGSWLGSSAGWLVDVGMGREPSDPPLCFPSSTPIAISLTETRPISDIRVGDTVLAFDPAADLGRGALVPRKVVRLYRNTTDEWVKLTWTDGGEAKELIATPSHHFLDRFGNFPTIEEMLENGRATAVVTEVNRGSVALKMAA